MDNYTSTTIFDTNKKMKKNCYIFFLPEQVTAKFLRGVNLGFRITEKLGHFKKEPFLVEQEDLELEVI